MIMELPVALFGQPILWLIGAELVEYPLACHYVQNAFKKAIMRDMTSTCSGWGLKKKFNQNTLQRYFILQVSSWRSL